MFGRTQPNRITPQIVQDLFARLRGIGNPERGRQDSSVETPANLGRLLELQDELYDLDEILAEAGTEMADQPVTINIEIERRLISIPGAGLAIVMCMTITRALIPIPNAERKTQTRSPLDRTPPQKPTGFILLPVGCGDPECRACNPSR